MIRTFRHKGIEAFFRTGTPKGINSAHAQKLTLQLTLLDSSSGPQDMNVPGWRLHELTGPLKGHWSVRVNGNWRLTFMYEDGDAILVDYQDYH